MKLIGMLGGTTWESTKEYYRILNEEVKSRLGGFHSARMLLYSVEFAEVIDLQRNHPREKLADYIAEVSTHLKDGGADFILLGANTMHLFAEPVEKATGLEVLHIGDVTADAIHAQGLKKVGLTGTVYTMEEDFIKDRYKQRHGIETIIPNDDDRKAINHIIYEELSKGIFKDESRQMFKDAIGRLAENGAEGVVLGCTELPLIVSQDEVDIPLFDTTYLHGKAAVDKALG